MSIKQLPLYCKEALLYYANAPVEYPGLPKADKAYVTLNALLMEGSDSEKARAREGKALNADFLKEDTSTAAFFGDLLVAIHYGGMGWGEQTTYRVSRKIDAEKLIHTGKTVSFTSTSKKKYLSAYADKEDLVLLEFHIMTNAPRADMAELLGDEEPRPGDEEVLLPPWLPVRIEAAELSAEESEIRDRNGEPPKAKYIVYTEARQEYPKVDLNWKPEFLHSEAGRRFYRALNEKQPYTPKDEEKYLEWKKKLLSTVVITARGLSLREIFSRELEENRYITNMSDHISDLLQKDRAEAWIRSLLGVEEGSSLAGRISKMSEARLSHTITTYLLGCHLQESLLLNFSALPRIFSSKTVGGAFAFYWTLICLCHDIGYYYENTPDCLRDKDKMLSPGGRQALLEIHSDMLTLSSDDLQSMDLTDEERQWAETSINLVRRYNMYRVGTEPYHKVTNPYVCADHGIVGGLILFDFLKSVVQPPAPHPELRDPGAASGTNPQTGHVAANRGHSRFLACALLIALTVARHNIWTQNEENTSDAQRYRDADLADLIVSGSKGKLSMEEPLNQMLFFLDYMDTIDPVKAFYVRWTEDWHPALPEEDWLSYLLDRVFLRCNRRGEGQHSVDILLEKPSKDPYGRVSRYCGDLCGSNYPKKDLKGKKVDQGLAGWLLTEQPIAMEDSAACLCFPVVRSAGGAYPCEITEAEIMDLCLYQGSGDSVRPGLFYQLPNAYQTLNLLMMKGLQGEEIRIGKELQRPNGIYIRDWRRTAGVFCSIFTAMCKYAACGERYPQDASLFRGDRAINTNMMLENRRTIAFTSTSKADYLEAFIRGKKDPTYVCCRLNERIPLVDFEEIFGKNYVFADEAEVLLPPFVEIRSNSKEITETLQKYKLQFGSIDFPKVEHPLHELEQILDANCEAAASTLDLFVKAPNTAKDLQAKDFPAYIEWKDAFRALVAIRLRSVYERYWT